MDMCSDIIRIFVTLNWGIYNGSCKVEIIMH